MQSRRYCLPALNYLDLVKDDALDQSIAFFLVMVRVCLLVIIEPFPFGKFNVLWKPVSL